MGGDAADALAIESAAKRRLADEYDAAQERGEVGQSGARTDLVPKGNEVVPPAADLGLTRREIHEARQIRDAEAAEPGLVGRTTAALLERGEEPTRAAVKRAAKAALEKPAGPRLQLPEGVTAGDHLRGGLALEAEGLPARAGGGAEPVA